MIAVNIINQLPGFRIPEPKFRKLVKHICKNFDVSGAVINIRIVDDKKILRINKKFLKHDRITDCISFDLSENISSKRLFDIVVNAQLAQRQAKQRLHTPQAEIALYITHGLLHNLGFDDSTERGAKVMHLAEDAVLQEFGYGKVYHK